MRQNSPQRGDFGGSPPWELADPPGLLDTAVDLPVADMTAPLPATPEPPDLSTRRRRVSHRGFWSLLDKVPWPLAIVLAAQAAMSLRLIWTNTAYLDEATYLFAGHVELAHWLHGTTEPAYATYFSGAPTIYPPLAALVADAGGLAAARMLSLVFMLGATACLWGMTGRLFGRWAAFTAAALFAALGPTQFLGAFATYDAMSLFLMSAAAWCAVTAYDRDDSSWFLIIGATLLAFANATKYASTLFDPTIVALAGLTVVMRDDAAKASGRPRLKIVMGRSGLLCAMAVAIVAGLLALGGSSYLAGILSTTVARASSTNPPSVILIDAAKWIGIACIPAVLAVLLALGRRQDRIVTVIVALLAVSAELAPLNQARIHTTTSLSKHVDFGVWFAAAAAGYLIPQLARLGRRRWAAATIAVAASAAVLVPAAIIGRTQSAAFFDTWPNSSGVTYDLQALTQKNPGNYLAEDYDTMAYYLQDNVHWQQWSDTWYFRWRPPGTSRTLTGLAAFKAAILDHYFKLVILDFGDTAQTDKALTAYIKESGTYHVIAEMPYWNKFGVGQFTVWQYQPAAATTAHRNEDSTETP